MDSASDSIQLFGQKTAYMLHAGILGRVFLGLDCHTVDDFCGHDYPDHVV